MRYRVSALLVVTALGMLGYRSISAPQETMPRLAYINSAAIIEQTPGASEAQATFDREMARWKSEVQVLADSLQQMISRYEQQQIMLSPEKRQERQQEILQKRLEYNQRLDNLQQAAQQRQQELIQPILDKISAALAGIREEQNYAMIFDVAAQALVAADTTLNITQLVIERLKAQAEAEQDSSD